MIAVAEGSQEEQLSAGECPECGGTIVRDYQRSKEICGDCGFVVRDGIKDRGPEWRSYDDEDEDRSRGGPPVTEDIHDKGHGTTLAPPTKDGKGKGLSPERRTQFGRLGKWQWRGSLKGNRGLKEGLSRAKTLSSRVGVPDGVSQRACHIYRLASEKDVVKGRSRDAFVAAAFFVACREAAASRSLEELTDCLDVDPSQVKNALNVLANELSIVPPFPGLSKKVNEMLEILWAEDTTREKIQEVIKKVEECSSPRLTGRSISGLAAGIVYLIFSKQGRSESEGLIADQAGKSRTTIQEATKIIEEEVL